MMRKPLFTMLLLLSACGTGGGPYPSLQPRAAEAIDPREPVVRPINDRPASPALEAQLRTLVDQAHGGDAAFGPAAAAAERLAAAAGPAQSESWITAEQALTAAIAARAPTATAQGDIDMLGATMLQANGGIAPNDLAAIKTAAAEVAGIARGQTDRIAAIRTRLGR
jgi:hypothetical protein